MSVKSSTHKAINTSCGNSGKRKTSLPSQSVVTSSLYTPAVTLFSERGAQTLLLSGVNSSLQLGKVLLLTQWRNRNYLLLIVGQLNSRF